MSAQKLPADGLTRVVIVDDHDIVRTGLETSLEDSDRLLVVGSYPNGSAALRGLDADAPDLIITDVQMPIMDGLELMTKLRETHPSVPVLLLTVVEDPTVIREALDQGAAGYLLKSASTDEIIRSVERALDGQLVVSAEVGSLIAGMISKSEEDTLSPREREVLTGVARGLTNAQVASQLYISETTVKTHLRRAFTKLGVQDRTSAVTEALQRGLIRL